MLNGSLVDLALLGPDELRDRLHALEADHRRVEADLAQVVGALDRTGAYRADGHASVRGLLRAEVRWSDAEVIHRLRSARLLAEAPEVGEALAAGAVGVAQVRALAAARANPRCGHLLADHLALLLDHARTLPFDDFARCVRRWEQLADADGTRRNAESAHTQRTASVSVHDGEGRLTATGGAPEMDELAEILRRYTDTEFTADRDAVRARWGDKASPVLLPRTDAQRRFDALVQIFRDAVSTPPGAEPPAPVVNITMDAVTFEQGLARMRVLPLMPGGSPVPALSALPIEAWRCETANGTVIDPCAAIAAALHGHVRRVVFDSAGTVIDLGRRQRLFTNAARDAVRLQATTCIWPGCTIPAGRCQSDHVVEWQHHGATSPDNGAPLCARHNRWKSRGYCTWRDADGHWHATRPDGSEIAPAEPSPRAALGRAGPASHDARPLEPDPDAEAQRAAALDRALALAAGRQGRPSVPAPSAP